ncbi:MAG: hypothetical protein WDM85_14010 [Caulobacteraceae bacterium]
MIWRPPPPAPLSVARLAAPLARRGELVWVMRRDDLYAPGLAGAGLPTERLIQVCARDDDEALAVMEDALRDARRRRRVRRSG